MSCPTGGRRDRDRLGRGRLYSGYSGCCGSPTGVGGATLGGANAPAIVITSKNPKHQSVTTTFNHYSLLGTIQQLWGLPCLANSCGITGGNLMTKLFVR